MLLAKSPYDRHFDVFAQPASVLVVHQQLLSWLCNNSLRLLLSEDNLSGLCKTSFKGHCLGMQTASRPYTPAETCYLKRATKRAKCIARHPGSKQVLLDGTSSESCLSFKKGGGRGGHWKLTHKPEPWWLQTHGKFKYVGILSLISSQRNDSHPLCSIEATASGGWTISLCDSDDEAGWRRERVKVLIIPGPENMDKVACQVLAVLAASWC